MKTQLELKVKAILPALNTVQVWTDGSCFWGDKVGGIGIYMRYGNHELEFCKGFKETKIGRMEVLAIIFALKLITRKDVNVILYGDSQYALNLINKGWAEDWLATNNFNNKANFDLMEPLIHEIKQFKTKPTLIHVKGHQGNEGNEKADKLAGLGRQKAFEGNFHLDTHALTKDIINDWVTIK